MLAVQIGCGQWNIVRVCSKSKQRFNKDPCASLTLARLPLARPSTFDFLGTSLRRVHNYEQSHSSNCVAHGPSSHQVFRAQKNLRAESQHWFEHTYLKTDRRRSSGTIMAAAAADKSGAGNADGQRQTVSNEYCFTLNDFVVEVAILSPLGFLKFGKQPGL
jgi:hypothetical protein